MKTNELKTNELSKAVKNDIKKVSAFYFVNELNKLAKKNEFCENVNIAELSNRLKTIHNERYGFNVNVLTKDYKGRFCTTSKIKAEKVMPVNEGINIETGFELMVDAKTGFELMVDENNNYIICRPIAPTLIAYINAFVQVVRRAEKAKEEAEKVAKIEAKKVAEVKEKRPTKKALFADLKAGRITPEEYIEAYNLLEKIA